MIGVVYWNPLLCPDLLRTFRVMIFLFISNLDAMLFVPVCTIDPVDMQRTVLKYPSFGEVEELGGPGPSLDALYAEVGEG